MQKRTGTLLPSAVFFFLISFLLLTIGQQFSRTISGFGIEQVSSFLQSVTFSVTTPFFPKNSKEEGEQQVVSNRAMNTAQQKEMQALRDQFETTTIRSSALLPAKIIGFEGFLPGVSRPTELTIGKGSADGVKIGQAVVVKDNLVGRISALTDHRSLVTLLAKSGWSFTAKTAKTGAPGLLVIEGGDMLLKNVVLSDSLEKKDLVVTNGEETIRGTGFPPDIVVGEIVSVDKKASALFQTARIRSFVNVIGLSTVFVYTE